MFGCNYLLLDGARITADIVAIKANYVSQGKSLYLGKTKEDIEDVGPFLFSLKPNDDLTGWFNNNGWGNACGLLVFSRVPYDDLFRHCRKFLLVKTEDQQELYFRFYDPRVLRIFLPTCSSGQLREFFGPIEFFILEDEDPNFVLKFWLDRDILCSDRFEFKDAPKDAFTSNEKRIYASVMNSKIIESNSVEEKVNSLQHPPIPEESTNDKPKKKWNDFFFE